MKNRPFLKPCPFCGSQPIWSDRTAGIHSDNFWSECVQCRKCIITFRANHIPVPVGVSAADFWNSRATPTEKIIHTTIKHEEISNPIQKG